MSNSYFQFKQFRIEQERCAMKVTTDACIQGAWTPVLSHVKAVLDIGAGTGLLSLMLAQESPAIHIDAIESDTDAAAQAAGNIAVAPWHDRLNVFEGDVRNYVFTKKYDLIITNPPFFSNSLQNEDAKKTMARHTYGLSYKELLDVVLVNLADEGYLSILLPATEFLTWKTLAGNAGLYEFSKLSVSHRTDAPVKRVVGLCSRKAVKDVQEQHLVIKDSDGHYTAAFIELLAPFYLDL